MEKRIELKLWLIVALIIIAAFGGSKIFGQLNPTYQSVTYSELGSFPSIRDGRVFKYQDSLWFDNGLEFINLTRYSNGTTSLDSSFVSARFGSGEDTTLIDSSGIMTTLGEQYSNYTYISGGLIDATIANDSIYTLFNITNGHVGLGVNNSILGNSSAIGIGNGKISLNTDKSSVYRGNNKDLTYSYDHGLVIANSTYNYTSSDTIFRVDTLGRVIYSNGTYEKTGVNWYPNYEAIRVYNPDSCTDGCDTWADVKDFSNEGGGIESDPIYVASAAHGITSTNISNWSSAYSWGNHAGLYRPISYVPAWSEITSKPTSASGWLTDVMLTSHAANAITTQNISDWNDLIGGGVSYDTTYLYQLIDSLNGRITDLEAAVNDTHTYETRNIFDTVYSKQEVDSIFALAGTVGYYDSSYVHQRIDSLGIVVASQAITISNFQLIVQNLSNAVETFTGIDITPPYPMSAEIGTYNDSIVILIFSENIQQDSIPPTSVFSLTEEGNAMGINTITISYDTMFIALDSTANIGSSYLLSYSAGLPAIQDSSNNSTLNFTNRTVTNNVSASVPAQNLSLWSEDLNQAGTWEITGTLLGVNQSNDLNGQPTLDQVGTGGQLSVGQTLPLVNFVVGNSYILAVEINSPQGAWGAGNNDLLLSVERRGVWDLLGQQLMDTYISASTTLVTVPFTITAGTINDLYISISTSYGADNNLNIGRWHVYDAPLGNKSYVTTTNAIVP
jgi:hypothetical protein